MKYLSTTTWVSFLVIGIALSACVYTPIKGDRFNKKIESDYLTFWYQKQILPAFVTYQSSTQKLVEEVQNIRNQTTPQAAGLAKLREAYKACLLSLQDVIIFDRTIFFDQRFCLYELAHVSLPNKNLVDEMVHDGTDLATLQKGIDKDGQTAASGYAAIDYILFSPHAKAELSEKELAFLHTVCNLQHQFATEALAYYTKEGENFTTMNDFAPNSSLSITVNTWMKQFEAVIRTQKIGVPIGFFGPGLIKKDVAPAAVEAYYAGEKLSTALFQRSLEAVRKFYYGIPIEATANETSGFGFKDFLDNYLPASEQDKVNKPLAMAIDKAVADANSLQENLPEVITSAKGSKFLKEVIYPDLQKIIGLLKAKMITALGLTVTYSDGEEGD